jgi:hypothetical protein
MCKTKIFICYFIYGCETRSLTLNGRMTSENRVPRRIIGPKREDVTGEWRKWHKKLYNLYSLPNIIRVITSERTGRVEHVAHRWR